MKSALALFAAIFVASHAANTHADAAAQINFRSTPGSTNYTSAGAPNTLDEDFTFLLGAFASGFTPGPGNTADWAANWTSLGRASYNTNFGWFTDATFLESNTAPFNFGGAAYIWGHDVSGEWILLTNPSWTWPAATGGIGNPGGTTFSVPDAGTTTILGTVNGVGFQMMTGAATGDVPDIVPSQWYAQHFSNSELANPAISGPLADPDGDGAVNLQELAAGTDPEEATSVRFATIVPYEDSGSTFYRLTLERVGRALIDHTLGVTQDLETWDLTGTTTTIVEDSSTMLILQSSSPVGTEFREFYRFVLNDPS